MFAVINAQLLIIAAMSRFASPFVSRLVMLLKAGLGNLGQRNHVAVLWQRVQPAQEAIQTDVSKGQTGAASC
ncbi:hypothetical protein [Caballeronia sp. DA-9]|uniref:hypothetical protein n=1 Tax=Caballeronia sp. DA-9 TaxID=3436237 RepID=UPI003F6763CB